MLQVDEEQGLCQAQVVLPLTAPKIPLARIVERVAATTMIRETKGELCQLPLLRAKTSC